MEREFSVRGYVCRINVSSMADSSGRCVPLSSFLQLITRVRTPPSTSTRYASRQSSLFSADMVLHESES